MRFPEKITSCAAGGQAQKLFAVVTAGRLPDKLMIAFCLWFVYIETTCIKEKMR